MEGEGEGAERREQRGERRGGRERGGGGERDER